MKILFPIALCLLSVACSSSTGSAAQKNAVDSEAERARAKAQSAAAAKKLEQKTADSRAWRAPVAQDAAREAAAQWLDHVSADNLPKEDGWVADWGIWGDNTEQSARDLYLSVPLELGLKYEFGTPKRELVVFSDPNGQQDRRLMAMLSAQKNLDAVVYVFPLPSALMIGNVERILCTSDPEKAWKDWMARVAPGDENLHVLYPPRIPEDRALVSWGEWEAAHPEILGCNAPSRASRLDTVASELGVSHTPTVLFANGRAWPDSFILMEDIERTWEYVHVRQDIPLSSPDNRNDVGQRP